MGLNEPVLAPAHFNLAKLLRGKLPATAISLRSAACWRIKIIRVIDTNAQRILLHFGLAQVLDARGEYAGAAEHLDRGNACKRKTGGTLSGQEDYDPQEYESLIARMIAACTP